MAFGVSSTLLDACVLAILDEEDTYGYVLTQRIKTVVELSESTLYPVLRRLQKDMLLCTYDNQFNGRNRRYYSITPKGKLRLSEYALEWEEYKRSLDKIIVGRLENE